MGDSSSYRIEIEQWVQFSQIGKLVGFIPFQTIFPFYSTYRERADSLIGSETKPAEQEPEKQKTTQNVTCFGSQERRISRQEMWGLVQIARRSAKTSPQRTGLRPVGPP